MVLHRLQLPELRGAGLYELKWTCTGALQGSLLISQFIYLLLAESQPRIWDARVDQHVILELAGVHLNGVVIYDRRPALFVKPQSSILGCPDASRALRQRALLERPKDVLGGHFSPALVKLDPLLELERPYQTIRGDAPFLSKLRNEVEISVHG